MEKISLFILNGINFSIENEYKNSIAQQYYTLVVINNKENYKKMQFVILVAAICSVGLVESLSTGPGTTDR